MSVLPQDPILSFSEAKEFEEGYFLGDDEKEWGVMNRAGEAVGDSALRDMRELRTIPHRPRILVLAGKGHNGADALLACKRFLRTIPTSRAVVWPWSSKESCRPLTQRAFEELIDFAAKRIEFLPSADEMNDQVIRKTFNQVTEDRGFDLLVDGLLGMQSRPGLEPRMREWIQLLNLSEKIAVRVAVDLPTGITEEPPKDPVIFRADFTYCTGIVKKAVTFDFNQNFIGRLRYLDLGFFNSMHFDQPSHSNRVLCSSALPFLRKLRPVNSDKRDFGHLLVLAGSRELGGAAMMTVQGALRAGVGLVTCCVPESLHGSMVASCPEAMWIPIPETPSGGLALEGLGKIRSAMDRASSLVTGPGVGGDAESHSLIREVCKLFEGPILLDADALRFEVIDCLTDKEKTVLTPHQGELNRISQNKPDEFLNSYPGVILLKGPHSRVFYDHSILNLFCGSSLLARGGSGDLLSGIIGALLARQDYSIADCVALGAMWHGRAAEALARQHGQEAVTTTQVLDYLSFALRNDF